MTAVADRVLAALGEALRSRGGDQLADLVAALAGPLDDTDQLLAPTADGWAAAFDVNHTPDPKWLGAATGTTVRRGNTAQKRLQVRDRPYWRRGTPAALVAAVKVLLTGTRRVDVFERDGSPWRLRVRTYAAETPVDVAAVLAAAASQTPVGIVLSAETVTGASYAHLAAEHPTYDDLAEAFPTYDVMHVHVPEPGTEP